MECLSIGRRPILLDPRITVLVPESLHSPNFHFQSSMVMAVLAIDDNDVFWHPKGTGWT